MVPVVESLAIVDARGRGVNTLYSLPPGRYNTAYHEPESIWSRALGAQRVDFIRCVRVSCIMDRRVLFLKNGSVAPSTLFRMICRFSRLKTAGGGQWANQ